MCLCDVDVDDVYVMCAPLFIETTEAADKVFVLVYLNAQ